MRKNRSTPPSTESTSKSPEPPSSAPTARSNQEIRVVRRQATEPSIDDRFSVKNLQQVFGDPISSPDYMPPWFSSDHPKDHDLPPAPSAPPGQLTLFESYLEPPLASSAPPGPYSSNNSFDYMPEDRSYGTENKYFNDAATDSNNSSPAFTEPTSENGADQSLNSTDLQESRSNVEINRMPIYVETLTGTTFEIQVFPYETILSLKIKLQTVEGISVVIGLNYF